MEVGLDVLISNAYDEDEAKQVFGLRRKDGPRADKDDADEKAMTKTMQIRIHH